MDPIEVETALNELIDTIFFTGDRRRLERVLSGPLKEYLITPYEKGQYTTPLSRFFVRCIHRMCILLGYHGQDMTKMAPSIRVEYERLLTYKDKIYECLRVLLHFDPRLETVLTFEYYATTEVIENVLLNLGIKPTLKRDDGMTMLEYARHMEMTSLLAYYSS